LKTSLRNGACCRLTRIAPLLLGILTGLTDWYLARRGAFVLRDDDLTTEGIPGLGEKALQKVHTAMTKTLVPQEKFFLGTQKVHVLGEKDGVLESGRRNRWE
jgi:hypothetical protein